MVSNHLFDNTGAPYNISQVLNADFTLNEAAYQAYGQPYQSAAYAIVFFFFFALYTATITHVGLYYHKEVLTGLKVCPLSPPLSFRLADSSCAGCSPAPEHSGRLQRCA